MNSIRCASLSPKEILETIIHRKKLEIESLDILMEVIPWDSLDSIDEEKLRLYFSKILTEKNN